MAEREHSQSVEARADLREVGCIDSVLLATDAAAVPAGLGRECAKIQSIPDKKSEKEYGGKKSGKNHARTYPTAARAESSLCAELGPVSHCPTGKLRKILLTRCRELAIVTPVSDSAGPAVHIRRSAITEQIFPS
jgi:hypothetical protein